jgi:type I restriction enzyme S subunit
MIMEQQTLPDGYKQTDLGVLPDDWDIKQVGEFASVSSGGTPSRDNKSYWGGNIPWVTTTLIKGQEINTAEQFITVEGLQNSATKWFKKGTILIAMYGKGKTRGQVAILGLDATINQACAAISVNSNDNQSYILHFLNSQYEVIRELSNSGGQENLNGNIVKSILIPLPPEKEQTAIANALSDVDALIVSIEKLIAKKQAIKTATMQQLLTGKKRLPPFDLDQEGPRKGQPKGTQQTELGKIPEDWSITKLGDLGQFKNGVNKDGDSFGHGHPFVNLMDVFGKASINSKENLGLIDSTILDRKEYDLNRGDVLFIRSSVKPSGVGLTALIETNLAGTVYSGFLIRYRANKSLSNEFKKYCFSASDFRKRIIAASSVSANTNINQDSLKQLHLVYPCNIDEQVAIGDVLSSMDIEVKALQKHLTKTQQIKQGMMQELLTGKTRLPFDKK